MLETIMNIIWFVFISIWIIFHIKGFNEIDRDRKKQFYLIASISAIISIIAVIIKVMNS